MLSFKGRAAYKPTQQFLVTDNDNDVNAKPAAAQAASMTTSTSISTSTNTTMKPLLVSETGRVSFPIKLHQILSGATTDASVIGWLEHGKAWKVHNTERFEAEVIPRYFELTKFSSFARQVNGWGFRRITRGIDKGGFYHDFFLRDQPELCAKMRRLKKKDGIDPFFAVRNMTTTGENNQDYANAMNLNINVAQQQQLMFGGMNMIPGMPLNLYAAAAVQHPSLALSPQGHVMALMQQQQAAQNLNGIANANASNGFGGQAMLSQLQQQLPTPTEAQTNTNMNATDDAAIETHGKEPPVSEPNTNASSASSSTPLKSTAEASAGGVGERTNSIALNDVNAFLQYERLRLQQAAIAAQRNAATLQMQANILLAQMLTNEGKVKSSIMPNSLPGLSASVEVPNVNVTVGPTNDKDESNGQKPITQQNSNRCVNVDSDIDNVDEVVVEREA